MTLPPRLRKLTLTAHVVCAVGWLGAVVAYLVLAVGALNGVDPLRVQAAYLALETIGGSVIVPFALAAIVTGLVQSLGTQWGLFRHYWIATKFVLTVIATAILLKHMPNVSRMAALAAAAPLGSGDHRDLRVQLVVHAGGGLLVLLTATALSVFKPWGMTPYGKRKQLERRGEPTDLPAVTAGSWGVYVLAMIGAVILIFVAAHLAGGGPRRH